VPAVGDDLGVGALESDGDRAVKNAGRQALDGQRAADAVGALRQEAARVERTKRAAEDVHAGADIHVEGALVEKSAGLQPVAVGEMGGLDLERGTAAINPGTAAGL